MIGFRAQNHSPPRIRINIVPTVIVKGGSRFKANYNLHRIFRSNRSSLSNNKDKPFSLSETQADGHTNTHVEQKIILLSVIVLVEPKNVLNYEFLVVVSVIRLSCKSHSFVRPIGTVSSRILYMALYRRFFSLVRPSVLRPNFRAPT